MIIDTLENFYLYESLNPWFAAVSTYMTLDKLQQFPEGKTILDGENVFVNKTSAQGKKVEQARLETHNRMIDIQIPLSGAETFGYSSRLQLTENFYDENRDITFYDEPAETYVTVHKGQFVIFFPQDGHAPCISDNIIEKVIFKVKNKSE